MVVYLRLGLARGPFPFVFPTKPLEVLPFRTTWSARLILHYYFYRPNGVWRGLQFSELLTVQISPLSGYFLPLRTKYILQHPILRHLYSDVFNVTDQGLDVTVDMDVTTNKYLLLFGFEPRSSNPQPVSMLTG